MKQPNVFPVISLYNPWASWVIEGYKTIETRLHPRLISLKGRTILIHAGKTVDKSEAVVKNPYLSKKQIFLGQDAVNSGCILGSAFVYDFKPLNGSHSKDALIDCGTVPRFGLFLKDIKKFETPIRARGDMGIWYFDLNRMQKCTKLQPQEKMF